MRANKQQKGQYYLKIYKHPFINNNLLFNVTNTVNRVRDTMEELRPHGAYMLTKWKKNPKQNIANQSL